MPIGSEEDAKSPGTEIIYNGPKLLCAYQEQNLGPQEEQSMISSDELSSLQLFHKFNLFF